MKLLSHTSSSTSLDAALWPSSIVPKLVLREPKQTRPHM
jgi:hypothetical protein